MQQGCKKSKNIESNSTDLPLEQEIIDESTDAETLQIRTTNWQTPEEQLAGFQLPPGFEITLFASEPDIGKPINIEFDVKGRLWVTQSSEYPFAAEPGEGSDRITILEDINGDGQADKFTHFVDTLNIPIGIMPIQHGAITFSIPNIYRFSDQDGDGYADDRKVLLGEFGYQDTHGMVNNFIRGFDGWIYANHGFTNTSTLVSPEGDSISMVSGNTFRFLPDGSRVEQTTVGRVNPFGFAYDEWGYLYSVDCHSVPIYQLINGAEYPSFGIRERPNIGFGPRMMEYNLGPTAVSGLVYYLGEQFPEEYRNSFYSGNVASSRVNRNTIEFVGSTPVATREEDFVISADPWFRPVDFKTGPDGSLYIADFYNRIIGHYEVPLDHPGRDRKSGRIWKITYVGNGGFENDHHVIDWSKATVHELVKALNYPVLNTRMKIANELIERYKEEAVNPVEEMMLSIGADLKSFVQGLWILHRLNALSDYLLENALKHEDPIVRVHGFRVMAEMESLSENQRILTLDGLRDASSHVQRTAIEVLSEFPHVSNIDPLLAVYSETSDKDTHLIFTALLSIKNQLKITEIMEEVVTKQWSEEQISILIKAIPDIPSEIAASFAMDYFRSYSHSVEEFVSMMPYIARYISINKLEGMISFVEEKFSDRPNAQFHLHQAIRQGFAQRGSEIIPHIREWGIRLAEQLLEDVPDKDLEVVGNRQVHAAELIEEYEIISFESALKELLVSTETDTDARVVAASALIRLGPEQNSSFVEKVFLDPNESLELREKITIEIGKFISTPVLSILQSGLNEAPRSLQTTIASVLASSSHGIDFLLQAINDGDVDIDILSEPIVKQAFMANIQDEQQEQLDELPEWQASREEREILIESRLNSFDPNVVTVESGKAIFEQYCQMCHQVKEVGGLIGPQLDGIGSWGVGALTEKIMDPNRNISESFRTHHITLTDGRTLSGLFLRQVGEVLIFANMSGEEFSVLENNIEERQVSEYSLMPDFYGEILDQEDFDALLKYLLNLE